MVSFNYSSNSKSDMSHRWKFNSKS